MYRIRHLIARGINPSCVDYDKRSALHIASTQGHFDVIPFSFNLNNNFFFFFFKIK